MEPSNEDYSSPIKGRENDNQSNFLTSFNIESNLCIGAPRPKSSKLPKPSNRDRGNTRGGSPPQEESVHSVRQAFQTALNKISQNETREIVNFFCFKFENNDFISFFYLKMYNYRFVGFLTLSESFLAEFILVY